MGIPSQEQVALLSDYDVNSPYTSAYYTLYANIRFGWDKNVSKAHSLLLTMPASFNGQPLAAANLAIAAAQNGTPTILVDADFQAGRLRQCFDLAEQKGLSDLFVEEDISPQAVTAYLSDTFVPGLRLLSSGKTPRRDLTLLSATKLQMIIASLEQVLTEAQDQSGLLLFHTAPVLANADAAQVGALVEQTFLAIIKGHTTRSQARQAQERLQRAHAQLVGTIMLGV